MVPHEPLLTFDVPGKAGLRSRRAVHWSPLDTFRDSSGDAYAVGVLVTPTFVTSDV